MSFAPLTAVQMVKTREDRRDRLTFRIEAREPFDPAALSAALLAAKPDLAKLLETGYLHPLAFEHLPPGGLPRLPVSGKLKRVLDLSR